jgi:hypothetical protein
VLVKRLHAEDARGHGFVVRRASGIGDRVEPPAIEDAAAPPLAEGADVPGVADVVRAVEEELGRRRALDAGEPAAICAATRARADVVREDGAEGEHAARVKDVLGRAKADGGAGREVDGRARVGTREVAPERGVERGEAVGGVGAIVVEAGEVLAEGLLGEVRPEGRLAWVGQVGWRTRAAGERRGARVRAGAIPRTRTKTRTAVVRTMERISSFAKRMVPSP